MRVQNLNAHKKCTQRTAQYDMKYKASYKVNEYDTKTKQNSI